MGERCTEAGVGLECRPADPDFTDRVYDYYHGIDISSFCPACDREVMRVTEEYNDGKRCCRNFLRRDDLIAALEYIFVFVLLWVESSFFAVNFLTGTARLLISALLALAVVLVNIKKRIDRKLLYSGSALAAWILAVGLIHVSDGYRQTVIMFVFFMTGMLFALHFDREIFVRRYVGIMLFLSVYSTVTFAVSLFIPHNCGDPFPSFLSAATARITTSGSVLSAATPSTRGITVCSGSPARLRCF